MGEMEFDDRYRAEHPRLVSALTVVARDPTIAGDVVDEACVRAYERWSRVGAMTSPSGWVYTTALNVFRRRHRRAAIEDRVRLRSVRPAAGPPVDWSVEVWDALARLPVRERTAVALRYVADLSTDQIAEAMGIARGTVGSTLHAARRNLAAALGDPAAVEELEEATDA